jgi:hypothetical protein
VLLRPQNGVARLLEITGADQTITVREKLRSRPSSNSRKGLPSELCRAGRATSMPEQAEKGGRQRSLTDNASVLRSGHGLVDPLRETYF